MPNQSEVNKIKHKNSYSCHQNHVKEINKILKYEENGQWLPLPERSSTGLNNFNYKQTATTAPFQLSDGFLCSFCFEMTNKFRQIVINHQEICESNFNNYYRAKDRRNGIYIYNNKYVCGFCRYEASSRKILTNHLRISHRGVKFSSMKWLYILSISI